MIQVGDRVVCINDKRGPKEYSEPPVTVGYEYVVRDIDGHTHGDREVTALDVGMISPTFECWCGDCNYRYPNGPWWLCATRFRKVEETAAHHTVEYSVDVKIEIEEPCLS